MAAEGSGEHVYDSGRFLCELTGDALCASVRRFIRAVSKPHDWGNSWAYDRDPESSTFGFRIVGGGSASLAYRVQYEMFMQNWSVGTMLPIATFTAFALYGDLFSPALYGARPAQ